LSKTVEGENEVQQLVWRAITVLRLFKVGSVRELSYTNESDSFFALGGTLRSHRHFARVATAVLDDEDRAAFENFWIRMMPQLPNEGYGHNRERVVSTDISYNRYSDALLSWGMPVERRISDAVIGLESLFLSEMDQLSYRLRLRVAKLLGIFGFVPGSVKETVGLAYEVRSCFLHGSHVSRKVLNKIERQHDGLDKLLLNVLDYLRCSIVTVILTAIHKAELINRLDASFLDEGSWLELNQSLREYTALIRPST
jgi:hypothetical protein